MARASGVTAVVDAAAVPYLEGVRESLADGLRAAAAPGATSTGSARTCPPTVDDDELLLLADAQTSGGLLLAGEVPGAPVVGEFVPRGDAVVVVR